MTPGTKLLQLEETDSTNTYVKENFDILEDGTLVTARIQHRGRGRLGRTWLSGAGLDLTGTFVLKNVTSGFHAGILTGLAALAMLRELAPEISPFLKWPNDIYVGSSKLAGLLGEGIIRNGRLAGVASGIGLNVNSGPELLSNAGQAAVSLKILTKKEFCLEIMANSLAKFLNRYYIIYLTSFDEIFREWRNANGLLGREIALTAPDGRRYEGVFQDITPTGEMVLKCDSGELIFNCGDVSVDKNVMEQFI